MVMKPLSEATLSKTCKYAHVQACVPLFFTVILTWQITELYTAFVLQLAAQVLEEFDDEDIGFGLLDAKLDKVVAKKLGKNSTE